MNERNTALSELPDGVTLEDLLIPLRAALSTCHDTDWSLRQFKTHITHALAALQSAQPAEVSDAQIMGCIAEHEVYQGRPGALLHFARAILALRPQAVPMTDEQVDRIWNALPMGNGFWLSFARATEAHHGIVAQRAQEGV